MNVCMYLYMYVCVCMYVYEYNFLAIEDHMAVSRSWVSILLGVLVMRALLLGVYTRAPDFWKLPYYLSGVMM